MKDDKGEWGEAEKKKQEVTIDPDLASPVQEKNAKLGSIREHLKTNETLDNTNTAEKSINAAAFNLHEIGRGETKASLRISHPSVKISEPGDEEMAKKRAENNIISPLTVMPNADQSTELKHTTPDYSGPTKNGK